MKLHNHTELSVNLFNQVRQTVLGASPVKSLAVAEGFSKLFKLVHPET